MNGTVATVQTYHDTYDLVSTHRGYDDRVHSPPAQAHCCSLSCLGVTEIDPEGVRSVDEAPLGLVTDLREQGWKVRGGLIDDRSARTSVVRDLYLHRRLPLEPRLAHEELSCGCGRPCRPVRSCNAMVPTGVATLSKLKIHKRQGTLLH
jgi:hypothetical protein